MHKSAATTTPYSVQEPPQCYPHTAHNPHRYNTDDDGDAGDDATSQRAGSTTQQELSSSGGPRGCIRQWLHRQWQQQRRSRGDGRVKGERTSHFRIDRLFFGKATSGLSTEYRDLPSAYLLRLTIFFGEIKLKKTR
ncbi:hypothetical protein EDB83DRAFT_2316787 [Lactarius deliciosus]|nr:hypothetical protein EDB83DRAFT_2316787 [Lactarius deliciosus]